jgi:hypothetical protein
MENRADDLSAGEEIPLPGTEEPEDAPERQKPTEGPGNISVDEPTSGALESADEPARPE